MKATTFLLSLCFCLSAFSQDFKFGKVSKEELQEKFNPNDSSASATYLYKYRRSFFEYQQGRGFYQVTQVHERIKIYNQKGFGHATKSILIYNNGGFVEKMSGLKAFTYNLDNGKIEETKLKKDGVFTTEYNKYRDITKFTMPNIKEGCIIEFEYRLQSPSISNIDEFVFQHNIPIKKLDAIFEAPEYFKFKVNTKGFLAVLPKIETKRDRITFTSKSGGRFSGSNARFYSEDIEFNRNISVYNLTNIPALKEESYVNNINNFRAAVNYELSYVKLPNSAIKYYSTAWEDVVKTIYKNPSFGAELDKSGYYEDEIDAIIVSTSDPIRRAAIIFNFLKTKVNWNGYYGLFTNDGVKQAFKNQVGNVAEINLMLTSMLRYAGVNANPVLVSTRTNGVSLFPTIEGYNYVICGIEVENAVILLDATNKFSMPNVLPFRVLNWEGRIIRKSGSFSTIELYPNLKSENTISMLVDLFESGGVEGGYRNIKTNHNALLFRESFNGVDEEGFVERLENKYTGLEISDFKVVNASDLSKPIMESYKFIKESQADVIDSKIYFSPLFFLKTSENPFKLEKREFPIDFGFPLAKKYRITVNLPKGYHVESIPETSVLMLPDNLGSFKYNISVKPNAIQLSIDSEINQAIISPIYYDAFKAYFNELVEKEAEQIVIIKK